MYVLLFPSLISLQPLNFLAYSNLSERKTVMSKVNFQTLYEICSWVETERNVFLLARGKAAVCSSVLIPEQTPENPIIIFTVAFLCLIWFQGCIQFLLEGVWVVMAGVFHLESPNKNKTIWSYFSSVWRTLSVDRAYDSLISWNKYFARDEKW